MSECTTHCVIIGLGIVGISCALRLLKDPKIRLTIITSNISPQTTSDGPAALIEPAFLNDDRMSKWFRDSLREFEIHQKEEGSGIEMVDIYEFFKEDPKVPEWSKEVPFGYGTKREELKTPRTVNTDFNYWWKSNLPTSDMSYYMPFLSKKLLAHQNRYTIKIEEIKTTLNEWIQMNRTTLLRDVKFIVNCSGMGARTLCNDKELVGARGMTIKYYAPHIKEAYYAEDDKSEYYSHLIPRRDGIQVVGTVFDIGETMTQLNEVTLKKFKEIQERAEKLVPDLKQGQIVGYWIGVRPYRTSGIRLETEKVGDKLVIHNYGHSGSGITLGHGCAQEVYEIIQKNPKSNL